MMKAIGAIDIILANKKRFTLEQIEADPIVFYGTTLLS